MLNVVDDQVVVEEKGIYSIENFLNARRLMYWQVYLHKTSVGAEKMLINLINRARELVENGSDLPASPALRNFLQNTYQIGDFQQNRDVLRMYGMLDDSDIWGAIKFWQYDKDRILSLLCRMLLERRLFHIRLSNDPISRSDLKTLRNRIAEKYDLYRSESRYLLSHGDVTNKAYIAEGEKINILTKKGEVRDIAAAADLPNIAAISKIVKKYYLCCPKNVSL